MASYYSVPGELSPSSRLDPSCPVEESCNGRRCKLPSVLDNNPWTVTLLYQSRGDEEITVPTGQERFNRVLKQVPGKNREVARLYEESLRKVGPTPAKTL